MKTGYWSSHKYYRLNLADYVEAWVGYKPLLELVELADGPREKAFLSTLFLTGGRVSEVLALRKNNFEIRREEGLIKVQGMPLLKRYKKIAKAKDGKRKWITERLIKTRKPFPILFSEPLTSFLLSWLDKCEGLLFPSPYKEGEPLTRFWAYKKIRSLDKSVNPELRQKLGLDKKFVVNGKKVSNNIHLWLHWFRSQRACCLVSEFGFQLHDLLDWFSWEHMETATHYAKKGWRGLAEKMLKTKAAA